MAQPEADVAVVAVAVPGVQDGVDKAWRKVVAGVDDRAKGAYGVLGEFAEPGSRIEVPAGALLLVVDETATGWDYTREGKKYATMDAALSLWLAGPDGELGDRPLWARHFKRSSGAFGTATRTQLRKYLAAHPPREGSAVRVVDAGPGRPNRLAGVCRWCQRRVPAGAGVLAGHGRDAVVEHPGSCQDEGWQPIGPVPCARCSVPVAPGTAQRVMVREGEGRWEVRHTGSCEGQISYQEYKEQAAARAAELRAQREAAQAEQAKKVAAAAARRQDKQAAARAGAHQVAARIAEHGVKTVTATERLYDKGLSPAGERMCLQRHDVVLGDDSTAAYWTVEVYGGRTGADPDDVLDGDGDGREGRFYLLADARSHYQRYSWQQDPPAPRAPRIPAGPPPAASGITSPWSFSAGVPGPRSPRPGLWAALGTVLRADLYPGQAHPLPTGAPGWRRRGERKISAVVTVVGEDRPEYSRQEDGMNTLPELMGEDGWTHRVYVRPATPEEAAPVLAREERSRRRRELEDRRRALLEHPVGDGTFPDRPDLTGTEQVPHQPAGTVRFILPDELHVDEAAGVVWWCQYNGLDGDNWDTNNWGSYRAWCFPLTDERRALIADLRAEYGGSTAARPR